MDPWMVASSVGEVVVDIAPVGSRKQREDPAAAFPLSSILSLRGVRCMDVVEKM
jgi:hypothetical protein